MLVHRPLTTTIKQKTMSRRGAPKYNSKTADSSRIPKVWKAASDAEEEEVAEETAKRNRATVTTKKQGSGKGKERVPNSEDDKSVESEGEDDGGGEIEIDGKEIEGDEVDVVVVVKEIPKRQRGMRAAGGRGGTGTKAKVADSIALVSAHVVGSANCC